MSELIPYICPQCGGRVNRATLVCEMCGTAFREDAPYHIVQIENPRVHTLAASVSLPYETAYALSAKELSELAMRELVQELSQCLYPFMDIKSEEASDFFGTKVTARIRILDPQYRFR